MTLIRNVVLACCALALPALAQGTPAAAPAPAPGPTFQSDAALSVAKVQKEMVSLVQAIPQSKFTWRPGKGVRSVSEVYAHAAGAGYWFGKQVGFQVPEGVQAKMKDLEKSTDKAQIEQALNDSFTWFSTQLKAMPDAELNKTVNLMGNDMSKRAVLLMALGHYQEHLGQSIAYARMNGVVPPWSKSDKS